MTKVAEGRRGNPGRRPLTWLLLLAFILQSFVTQTHVHGTPQAARAALGMVLQKSSTPGESPIKHDATTCPFCQAIVLVGAFFASATPLLPLPVIWAECTTTWLIAIAVRAPVAHSWQSRAPPQH